MSDDADGEESKRKGKKTPEAPPDKSTPDARDPKFLAWLEGLWRDDERVQFLSAFRVFQKGKIRGERLAHHAFRADRAPTRLEMVAVTNDFVEAMQNDANTYHEPRRFDVEAHNSVRGGVTAIRSFEITPNRVVVRGLMQSPEQDEEETHASRIEKLGFEREKLHLEDHQWHTANNMKALGEQLMSSNAMVKDLHGMFMSFFKQHVDTVQTLSKSLNDAQNDRVHRDAYVAKEKFRMELQRGAVHEGVNLLKTHLPNLLGAPQNGAASGSNGASSHGSDIMGSSGDASGSNGTSGSNGDASASGRPPEADRLLRIADNLSAAEKVTAFGQWRKDWDGREVCLQQGILTEEQCRIFVAVMECRVGVDALDRLVDGPDALTGEQGAAIISSGIPLGKLADLDRLLSERRAKVAQRNNGTHERKRE